MAPYGRIVSFFDEDETAGSFLREDGDGGFVGAIYSMAREIDRLRALEPVTSADGCEYCVDGLQADGETPCPSCVKEPSAPSKEWRCFHCDEVFFTANDARLHFGMDQCSDPACKIKMGAEKSLLVALRRAETELQDAWAAIHNENTEAAKAYYAQQSRHGEQLRAAEELGFERGIADLGSIWDDLKSLSNAANDLASWAGCVNWRGGENQKDWLDELRQHIESVQALCKPYLPKSETEA